ncbi:hypothetical protein [Catenovulum sediminis]|uniref:SRPBCC family protein n=1 Tax=Catenovulum sediminis TaxID=1740262 RepID=A0ABV1REA0_9ALTE
MKVEVAININVHKELVWKVICDVEDSINVISNILSVKLHHKPSNGLVGLKWTESRLMFGKEAEETMWITEALENSYYCTRAESHGSVYLTKLSVETVHGSTWLSIQFTGYPQSFFAKCMYCLMKPFMQRPMIKALQQDLEDIKEYCEQKYQPN